MPCPRCRHDNPPGAAFCGDCGAPIDRVCHACGSGNPPANKFCHRCGSALVDRAALRLAAPLSYTPRHLADKILTSKAALEGERKQVSVLFGDLAGSTTLAERLGMDVMHGLLDRFFDLVLAEVHRYEGTVNQFLGDGVMALFGAPVAHEDHARRAVLAALAIQRGIGSLPAMASELKLRIGLNTGPVVVGKIGDNLRMDYTAVGDTTNLAARLQQMAEPGTVCLSEHTYRAAAAWIEADNLGAREVRGRSEPVVVYRARGVRARPDPATRDLSSPLVGRARELETLASAVARLAEGRGGVVSIVGEAGLGKSRLIAELRRLAQDGGVYWLEGRAPSFGQALGYWPFIEMLKVDAGITEDDPEDLAWQKLERRLREHFAGEADEVLPYVATLLGLPVRGDLAGRVMYLDAQAVRRQILLTSRRLFARLAAQCPLALVFEDYHWIDRSSAELLDHVVPLVERAPLLVVVAARPDDEIARFRATTAAVAAGHTTEITLAPLSSDESSRLVGSLLGADEPPTAVRELVLGKADGNPFFIEEVVRTLVDARALVRDDDTRRWRATAAVHAITIPDTVQGVIAARIDRLDEELKSVLKLASVIGRTFLYRVLRSIGEANTGLDRHLALLEGVELIHERQRAPELEYAFRHALVQETTYASILLDRRRRLHGQVTRALETLFADRLEEFYGVLAYHASLAEDWERAQEYLTKAGDQAGRVAADAEALAHYGQAIEVFARARGDDWDPTERAALERKVGEALFRRGQHEEALEYFHRALRHLGVRDPATRWSVRRAIAAEVVRQAVRRLTPFVPRRAPAAPGLALTERSRIYEVRMWIDYFVDQERLVLDSLLLLNFSERHGLAVGRAEGATGVGLIADALGLPRLAGYYHRCAVALAEVSGQPQPLGMACLGLGMHAHLSLGDDVTALEQFRRSARIFRDIGEVRGWGATATLTAVVLRHHGDLAESIRTGDELIRLGREAGDRQVLGWGLLTRGAGLECTGSLEAAIAALEEARRVFLAIPADGAAVEAIGFLARCYLDAERLDDARTMLDEGAALIARRRLNGHQIVHLLEARIATELSTAERTLGADRAKALTRAGRELDTLDRATKAVRPAMARARQLRGTLEWLRGRRTRALSHWQRSVTAAEALGARLELGQAYLERGRQLGDRSDLARAESVLGEIGALRDAERARALLRPEGGAAG